MPQAMREMRDMHDVFVSYASEDAAAADAVRAALESAGIRCWIAPRDITPGVSWPAAIVKAIGESRAMLLVFSPSSNNSEQTKREVAQAVSRGLPVLPVRIAESEPSGDMAYFLVTPHWLDAHAPPLEQHLRHLVDTVKTILGRPRDPAAPPPAPPMPRVPAAPARPAPLAGGRHSPQALDGRRRRAAPAVLTVVCLACLALGAWGAYALIHSRAGPPSHSAGPEAAADPARAAPLAAAHAGTDDNPAGDNARGTTAGSTSGGGGAANPGNTGAAGDNPGVSRIDPGPAPAASVGGNAPPVATAAAPSTAPAAPSATSGPATAPAVTVVSAKPGADVASAVPVPLGQVVAARLEEPTAPGGRHFWAIDVPAGDYRLVLDLRPASGEGTNVGAAVTLVSPRGEDLDRLLFVSEAGFRVRAAAAFEPKLPTRALLRVDGGQRPTDYCLGLFPRGRPVPAPYFTDRPPVERLALDKPAISLLDGHAADSYAAWYAPSLPPGDYQVTAEFRAATGKPAAVVGYVDVFDADGVERKDGLIFVSEAGISVRQTARLTVPAGAGTLLRVRAGSQREYATVTVTR